jgi:hypothetical protein
MAGRSGRPWQPDVHTIRATEDGRTQEGVPSGTWSPACMLTVPIGPAGAGKSTAAARHWPAGQVLSPDECARYLTAKKPWLDWGLAGAEAILEPRALIASGDFDESWPFHLRQEHQRVHRSRYGLAA